MVVFFVEDNFIFYNRIEFKEIFFEKDFSLLDLIGRFIGNFILLNSGLFFFLFS